MAKKAPYKTKTPLPTVEESIARYALMDRTVRQSGVSIDELEKALGMYMVGFHFGWKVLHVIHSRATIRKYEAILGISTREVFDEFGPDAERTNAYQLINSVSSFWEWLAGREKPPIDLDRRAFSE